jgi:ribosomal protein S19
MGISDAMIENVAMIWRQSALSRIGTNFSVVSFIKWVLVNVYEQMVGHVINLNHFFNKGTKCEANFFQKAR